MFLKKNRGGGGGVDDFEMLLFFNWNYVMVQKQAKGINKPSTEFQICG